jgi:hypothetical protein
MVALRALELQRLNVIVTLKAFFGLTLEQIRTQLATDPPPLASVLQLHRAHHFSLRDLRQSA